VKGKINEQIALALKHKIAYNARWRYKQPLVFLVGQAFEHVQEVLDVFEQRLCRALDNLDLLTLGQIK